MLSYKTIPHTIIKKDNENCTLNISDINTKSNEFVALLRTETVFFLIGNHSMHFCTTAARQQLHLKTTTKIKQAQKK